MAGDAEQREPRCQLSLSHVVGAATFAKEALHIKEHLPNINLPLAMLGSKFYGGLLGMT